MADRYHTHISEDLQAAYSSIDVFDENFPCDAVQARAYQDGRTMNTDLAWLNTLDGAQKLWKDAVHDFYMAKFDDDLREAFCRHNTFDAVVYFNDPELKCFNTLMDEIDAAVEKADDEAKEPLHKKARIDGSAADGAGGAGSQPGASGGRSEGELSKKSEDGCWSW